MIYAKHLVIANEEIFFLHDTKPLLKGEDLKVLAAHSADIDQAHKLWDLSNKIVGEQIWIKHENVSAKDLKWGKYDTTWKIETFAGSLLGGGQMRYYSNPCVYQPKSTISVNFQSTVTTQWGPCPNDYCECVYWSKINAKDRNQHQKRH